MDRQLSPSPKELDYIKRRARQGASSKVIATELEFECHVKRDAAYVDKIRADHKLPPENSELVRQHTLLGHTGHLTYSFRNPTTIDEAKKTLSAGAFRGNASRGFSPPKVKTTRSEKKPEINAKERSKVKVDFKLEPMTKPKVGDTYIVGVTGVVVVQAIETKEAAGLKLEVATLIAKYGKNGSNMVNDMPVARFSSMARKPASPDVMESIMRKLEFGTHQLGKVPIPAHQPAFFERIVNGLDLDKIADVICYFYSTPGKLASTTAQINGDKAIHLIAAEYAHVMEQDYEQVHRRITDFLGRTKPAPESKDAPPQSAPNIPGP